MDFTFDVMKTPVIGKRWLKRQIDEEKAMGSPRRSLSLSPADSNAISGWKRPWMSQVYDEQTSITEDLFFILYEIVTKKK